MKKFDIEKEIPRLGKRAEITARWYLRFNGYFPVESFILHDAGLQMQRGGQLGETDILALRLPHTQEIIRGHGKDIVVQTHRSLDVRQGMTDFVVAEVSSHDCKFNWADLSRDDQPVRKDFLEYALRRFGHWGHDSFSYPCETLSSRKQVVDDAGRVRIRLVSIGVAANNQLRVFVQITFADIFEYLKCELFSCYDVSEGDKVVRKVVSDHKQWDPLICEIYNRLRGHKTGEQMPADVVRWLFPDAAKEPE